MKKLMQNLLTFVFLNFSLISTAFSYSVYSDSYADLNFNKEFSVLVLAGHDKSDGAMFSLAALSKQKMLKKYFPNRQIIILAESSYDESFAKPSLIMTAHGLNLKYIDSSEMHTRSLVDFVLKFGNEKLMSLDIFSHGNPMFGPKLQGQSINARLVSSDLEILKIKSKFSEESYIIMHGCNTGWVTAPYLSKMLNVPVAGSLTGTEFHTRIKSETDFGKKTQTLYESKLCKDGPCMRMMPQPAPYKSASYGDLSQVGLGFYKFFCQLSDDNSIQASSKSSQKRCFMAMAQALKGFPSKYNLNIDQSISAFKNTTSDFMCGSLPQSFSRICFNIMTTSDLKEPVVFKPFDNKTLDCSFSGCKASLECDIPDYLQGGRYYVCKIGEFKKTEKNMTYFNEMIAYMYGFKFLQESRSVVNSVSR